jgi:hypothetical protein
MERLATALEHAEIRYLIIGGQAVIQHGYVRFTKDVDLEVGMWPAQVDRLLPVLRDAGIKQPPDDDLEMAKLSELLKAEDEQTGIRVDIALTPAGLFDEAHPRGVLAMVVDREHRFIDYEHLLIRKMIAGRPRDRVDIEQLLVRQPDADHAYVEQYLTMLEDAVGRPLIREYRELRDAAAR